MNEWVAVKKHHNIISFVPKRKKQTKCT